MKLEELKKFLDQKKTISNNCRMCCSSRKPRDVKREPYIDLVIGPQAYHKINETILGSFLKKKKN